MSAEGMCDVCGVNTANGSDGLCAACRKATDRLIADVKKSGKKR